jgi:hypothetical protein
MSRTNGINDPNEVPFFAGNDHPPVNLYSSFGVFIPFVRVIGSDIRTGGYDIRSAHGNIPGNPGILQAGFRAGVEGKGQVKYFSYRDVLVDFKDIRSKHGFRDHCSIWLIFRFSSHFFNDV